MRLQRLEGGQYESLSMATAVASQMASRGRKMWILFNDGLGVYEVCYESPTSGVEIPACNWQMIVRDMSVGFTSEAYYVNFAAPISIERGIDL